MCYYTSCITTAAVAHPVERHLAKVEVASSSLVSRSMKKTRQASCLFLFPHKNGRNPGEKQYVGHFRVYNCRKILYNISVLNTE